jgi:hypothetical protein
MSRALKVTHEQIFQVFAGNQVQAQRAHGDFTTWLASNGWGQSEEASRGSPVQAAPTGPITRSSAQRETGVQRESEPPSKDAPG